MPLAAINPPSYYLLNKMTTNKYIPFIWQNQPEPPVLPFQPEPRFEVR